MAMRESEGSLRVYFLLAGVIGLANARGTASTALGLTHSPTGHMAVLWGLIAATAAVSVGYVAAAIRLKSALPLGAIWVQRVLLAGFIVCLVHAIFSSSLVDTDDARTGGIVGTVIAMLVTTYLLVNVRRLVGEARARAVAPIAVANPSR